MRKVIDLGEKRKKRQAQERRKRWKKAYWRWRGLSAGFKRYRVWIFWAGAFLLWAVGAHLFLTLFLPIIAISYLLPR